jgi:hypothetical protein
MEKTYFQLYVASPLPFDFNGWNVLFSMYFIFKCFSYNILYV